MTLLNLHHYMDSMEKGRICDALGIGATPKAATGLSEQSERGKRLER